MRFEALLEKKEAKQLLLLKSLMMCDGTATIQAMSETLQMTKKSVETYIEDLQSLLKQYEEDCVLTYDGQTLTLHLVPEFSLNMIESSYYEQAVKYRILLALLYQREFSAVSLANELAISESSLSRKIRELNELLQEFGLMIWQGKIVGEELQIRYFYFQLLWYMNHFTQAKHFSETKFTQQLARGLNISFSKHAQARIALWIEITKLRLKCSPQMFTTLNTRFVPYERDVWYLRLKELIYRSFGHYAVGIRPEEAKIHFIFLISMSILSEGDFARYDLERSRFTPTALVDTYILENVLMYYRPSLVKREIEANCYYQLAQIHPRLYFFQGDVEVYNRENIWSLEAKLSSRNMQVFAEALTTQAVNELQLIPAKEDSLIEMTKVKYLSLLAVLDYHVSHKLQIGIDLQLEGLFKEAATHMLMIHLQNIAGVVVQTYQTEQSYDLIITNQLKTYDVPTYRLSELGTNYDIAQIKQMIRTLESV